MRAIMYIIEMMQVEIWEPWVYGAQPPGAESISLWPKISRVHRLFLAISLCLGRYNLNVFTLNLDIQQASVTNSKTFSIVPAFRKRERIKHNSYITVLKCLIVTLSITFYQQAHASREELGNISIPLSALYLFSPYRKLS